MSRRVKVGRTATPRKTGALVAEEQDEASAGDVPAFKSRRYVESQGEARRKKTKNIKQITELMHGVFAGDPAYRRFNCVPTLHPDTTP